MKILQVPFVDLIAQHRGIQNEILMGWREVLDTAGFILGTVVQGFERAFAEFCGTRHAVGVGNGTDALVLALKALGIKQGDEVITAANSFVATAEAIVHAGAKPVFVDTDPSNYSIDASRISAAISPRTRAIVPVHLYGNPAPMDEIMDLAAAKGIYVVEDSAQAHGAYYKGRRVGSIGHVSCFSFYPAKNLGACGDAGAVVTSDDKIAESVRKLRDHGGLAKYQHDVIGYNSRLDAIHAKTLLIKLKHLDEWNKSRIHWAQRYSDLMKNIPGIEHPCKRGESVHVFHLYVIRVSRGDRGKLAAYLKDRGISVGIHYPEIIPDTPAFRELAGHAGKYPVAHAAAQQVLSLPMYPELDDQKVCHVAECIADFQRGSN
jgi:dTDP-4-amino-4,6-dideoxygalactose transaminase